MGHQVLLNCKLYLGGFDLSGDLNALGLSWEAETVDDSTFGSGTTRAFLGGLKRILAQHAGHNQYGTNLVDEVLFNRIGVVNQPMTIAPLTGAEGEPAYAFQSSLSRYSPIGGAVGTAADFDVTGEASGTPLIRGTIAHNATRTATGNGTAFNLGAVGAAQKLYAALHVLAVGGTATPTLTVKVQSDDASGFASPTDRITFTAATAIGAQWATPVPGSITDAWWRATWTISGTTPSFLFVVLAGIQ